MRDTDEPRFHRLYQANFRSIQAYAVNRVGSADDAADIVAEVFTAAWRRLDDIPPPPADRLWLYGTARGKLTSAVGNPGSNGTLAATTIEQDALAAKPTLPHLRHSLPSGLPTKLPGLGNGHRTSLPKPPSAGKIGSLFSGLGCSQSAIATTDLVTMAG